MLHPWVLVLLAAVPLIRGNLRRLTVALLILAAAGVRLPLAPGLTVVMLDQSPSAAEGTRAALSELDIQGPVRYLAFAEQASWVQNPFSRAPLGEATNFPRALQAALEANPDRILLISDGLFPTAPSSVPIDAYPVEPAPRVAITGLITPPFPTEGELIEVRALVEVSRPTEAELTFTVNGQTTTDRRSMPKGRTGFGHRFVLEGPTRITVRLKTPLGSDQKSTTITPVGKAEVLVIGDPAAAKYLQAQGFSVLTEAALPEKLPRVVVIGASSEGLGARAPERLKRFLEDGGGLLFTATPKGLFFGDWHRVFEDLPVEPKPGEGAAFVLVIDTSGSMQGNKLDRAVEGALRAVNAAREADRLGVIAFASSPRWLLTPRPMTYRAKREAEVRLKALAAGGGTNLPPALATAIESLKPVKATKKWVLVISDGATEGQAQALTLARQASGEGIVVHTLALGADADRAFLKRLAGRGGGRYLEAKDPSVLAGLIEAEAKKAFATESLFGRYPLTLLPHPVTRALTPPPPARVLLPATRKPWAKTVIQSGDLAVLALGERSYGRVAALTTDLGQSLQDWPDTPRLLANLVRWLADTPARPRYRLVGETLVVEGRFDAPPRARIAGKTYPLAPVAPFRYELRLPENTGGDAVVLEGARVRFRVPLARDPEWPATDGRANLAALAKASGGRLLEAPRLGPPPKRPFDLSPILAALAILTLLLERFLIWRAGDRRPASAGAHRSPKARE